VGKSNIPHHRTEGYSRDSAKFRERNPLNLAEFVELRMPFGCKRKWLARKAASAPKGWASAYPEAEFEVITPENTLGFLT
jgi:hypothetical protein